ncbi:unnamed protein product [Orchesella dallaii]|uniref:Odorant receptor n=1 Tax=Orchesella dallaii TaxID=48710 RepID=A0ABP1RMG5_9HEXA
MESIKDTKRDEHKGSTHYKDLGTTFTILVGLVLLLCCLVVSILKQLKEEVCNFYNGIFQMDMALKRLFKNEDENREQLLTAAMNTKECKMWANVLALASFCTLFPPIVMFLFMFHPCDPMHRILVDLMEIKVTVSSPRAIILASFYGWGVFAICCTFVSFIYAVALTIASSTLWLNALMPTGKVAGREADFQTQIMGPIEFSTIRRIYRCHQLLCVYQNAIVAKIRIAVHFLILHTTVILAACGVARNEDYILEMISKCRLQAYVDTFENIQRLKLRLAEKFPHHEIAMSKQPFDEMYENWEVIYVPISAIILLRRSHSLFQSGLVHWWNSWAFRVSSWNITVAAARNDDLKAVSLQGNIQVLFYLYLGMIGVTIIIFSFEISRLLIAFITPICETFFKMSKI